MRKKIVAEILAAHADGLVGNEVNGDDYLSLFPDHRSELAPLLQIAERVKVTLSPVTPSPAFTAGLRQDLLAAAVQRAEKRVVIIEKGGGVFLRRHGVLVGAVVGSILSVAGIIVALVWRQRSMARA